MEYLRFHKASSLNLKNYKSFNDKVRDFNNNLLFKQKNVNIIEEPGVLNSLLKIRKNNSDFSTRQLDLNILNSLLVSIQKSYYPSAGGFYNITPYIFNNNIKNLKPGIYSLKDNLSLELLAVADMSNIVSTASLNHEILKESSFYIIFVLNIDNLIKKYGDRGYRFGLQESGHIAQNLVLKAAEINVKAFISGGYFEEKYSSFLDLKSNELVVYEIAFGS
ncbi:SagB/ThcOx family dehydrogenase [Mammaliicoccus sciuri]|uniref:SagB/ThcOx family dehydrogenase n=1 Tax=Mammaliicoccus sciuri TaxID=1296 RepID=UPI003F5453CF